jgi:hypothetical protein
LHDLDLLLHLWSIQPSFDLHRLLLLLNLKLDWPGCEA